MTTPLAQRARLMHHLTVYLLLTLILSISIWNLWLSPEKPENLIAIWLIQVVPLALFLPGVVLGKPRTHIWLCFVILVYFCSAILLAINSVHAIVGLIQSLLCALLFCSAMLFVRWNGMARRRNNSFVQGSDSESLIT